METTTLAAAHVFSGDKPIFVVQYMTGVTGSGSTVGDPAMGNMTPSEQYLSAYTFSTVGGSQFVDHYLSIIAEDDDVTNGTILLDGVTVPAAEFTAIASTGLSYALLELDEGTHTTQSAALTESPSRGSTPRTPTSSPAARGSSSSIRGRTTRCRSATGP